MLALYRKWRPQVWDDLVGQEHISKTLINAIESGKLTHAYMFCGSRGTGKTTTARILAKSLNCENRVNGSPCNNCSSCQEISSGASLDVIEIDAASNRGISEIKTLIEQVRFASVGGKYKVYIIDEFHMLTTEAFNALLKTLEEPPTKVIFVLATTEAHKILPTIVSRCQRFDFQRITVSILVSRLKYVADKEDIKISDESLLAIARKANGGLRDALSLLDQISAFSMGDGQILPELVNQVLGLVSTSFLVELVEAISQKDHMQVIQTLNQLLKAGNDPNVITTETINFFRHLLIIKSAPDSAEALEVPMSNFDVLKKTAELFSSGEIINILEFLNNVSDKIKKTQTAQLWLEVNFVQLCKKEDIISSEKIITKPNIEQIESVSQVQNNTNIDDKTINNLLSKISELENKLDRLAYAQSQSANKISNMTSFSSGQEKYKLKEVAETIDSSSAYNKDNFSINDMKGIWERILIETKKKNIPAHALLCNGKLMDINENIKTITVHFDNEAFGELLKNKYIKVEQALAVVFGTPYKLSLGKGELEKKAKASDKSKDNLEIESTKAKLSVNNNPETSHESNIDKQMAHSNNQQKTQSFYNPSASNSQIEQPYSLSNNESVNNKESEQGETKHYDNIVNLKPNNNLNNLTEQNIENKELAIDDGLKVKQATLEYKIEPENYVDKINEKEENTLTEEQQEEQNDLIKLKQTKELYLHEVADVFKGKIIKGL